MLKLPLSDAQRQILDRDLTPADRELREDEVKAAMQAAFDRAIRRIVDGDQPCPSTEALR